MKTIRKVAQNPLFIFILITNFLFVSCSQSESSTIPTKELDGKELFKSIVFADGALTSKIYALENLSQIKNFSKTELNKYRALQNDFISYMSTKDAKYFDNFKSSIYSKNPEIISDAIISASKELTPWINAKLSLKGLTLEKLTSELKLKGNNLNTNPIHNAEQKQQCAVDIAVFVAAVAIVAVVVIAIVGVTNNTDGSPLSKGKRNSTLDAISIQIAENA